MKVTASDIAYKPTVMKLVRVSATVCKESLHTGFSYEVRCRA